MFDSEPRKRAASHKPFFTTTVNCDIALR